MGGLSQIVTCRRATGRQRAVSNKHTSSRINFPLKQQDQHFFLKLVFPCKAQMLQKHFCMRVNPTKQCSGSGPPGGLAVQKLAVGGWGRGREEVAKSEFRDLEIEALLPLPPSPRPPTESPRQLWNHVGCEPNYNPAEGRQRAPSVTVRPPGPPNRLTLSQPVHSKGFWLDVRTSSTHR